MHVWVKNGLTFVKCQYNEKEIVKAIGDYKFDKTSATWVFPLYKLVNIIDNLHIEYNDETYSVYESLRKDLKKLHAKINLANDIKSGKILIPKNELRECYYHQKQAIKLGMMFDSYALFMDTGCGKSLAAIKIMEYRNVPTIIVAPLSTLVSVWERELHKWSKLPNEKIINLWKNLHKFTGEHSVYLINYEQFKILNKKEDISKKVDMLIIDESSKLKNPRSAITKAILSCKDKIKYRICLTGTPAPNDILEYWSQMEFINDRLL